MCSYHQMKMDSCWEFIREGKMDNQVAVSLLSLFMFGKEYVMQSSEMSFMSDTYQTLCLCFVIHL